jgi:hypothetical protein
MASLYSHARFYINKEVKRLYAFRGEGSEFACPSAGFSGDSKEIWRATFS